MALHGISGELCLDIMKAFVMLVVVTDYTTQMASKSARD